ncbi:MAG: ABC transporter permease subunit, partial [Anaerolineae bacterium]|nr:ABC transporter permease subunit [Anaerolineae bacterium]
RFGAFYDLRGGTAAALPLLGLGAAAFAAQRWLADRRPTAAVDASVVRRRQVDPGCWRWPLLGATILPALISTAAPLAALVWQALSLRDYALAWEVAQREVLNSLGFSLIAAALAVLAALPVAWLVVRSRSLLVGRTAEVLALAPLAVPGLVLGIGLIRLWNRGQPFAWVYQSLWIVVLGDLGRALPFVVVALLAGWRQVPVVLEECARLAGASALQTLRYVLLPLLRSALVVAWCLGFAVSITELQTTLLVYPPGHATLPVRIFTLQHDGLPENVAGLCLTLIVMTLLPVGAAWALARRGEGAA